MLVISCRQDEKQKSSLAENPYYDRAWYFLDNNLSDSSFIYFNKAKEKALNDGDSVKLAKSLINMAIISGDRGDYFGSQEISLSAIKYLNSQIQEQREILSSNYNNLGKMAHLLKKYEEANKFYTEAIALTKNNKSKAIYLNNIAINLSSDHKYADALDHFRQLKTLNTTIKDDSLNYARALSNTAITKWMLNPNYNPVPEILNALRIREKEKDLWGQNASLGHLADYYYQSKPDSALFYTHIKYKIDQEIKSADDQLNSLQMLIRLSRPTDARRYFEIYEQLQDSVQTERGAAKNQFALIRYETEKNKAENLRLQKDVAEKKYQITRQQFLLIVSFLVIIMGSIMASQWYKKRKQKLELEARAAIRESQLKTSKKVHDVVANGLYRMMSVIENQTDLVKDDILDRIEVLYEKSRDISYEDSIPQGHDFQEKVNALLTSFASENTKVSLVGNDDALWSSVSPKAKDEMIHVLQELMVNMKKHSGAGNVVVKFERVGNQININYSDDGVGIKGPLPFKNGLTNTGNRIYSIGGVITFDTETGKGLKVRISVPIT